MSSTSAPAGAYFYAAAPTTIGNIIAGEGPAYNFVTVPVRSGAYFLSSIGAAKQNIPMAYTSSMGLSTLTATGSGDGTSGWGA
jgi:hypothetical protein